MRHEFHDQLQLSAQQEKLLEYHSLLNLFNVLELQLSALAVELTDPDIHRFSRFCLDILMELPHRNIRKMIPDIRVNCSEMRAKLIELRSKHSGLEKMLDGLIATTHVGHDRFEEFESPRDEWRPVTGESIKAVLRSFLTATSVVSGDRFTFTFAPEPPRKNSYWIDFQIAEAETLSIPGVLNDTIRDLVSNSRKYSEPGSSIRIRINRLKKNDLRLVVIDEGIGIPADELPSVIKYGYRATNTMDRRTMGGGIGLTKAYQLCRRFAGRFAIDSELGKGTTVDITLCAPS